MTCRFQPKNVKLHRKKRTQNILVYHKYIRVLLLLDAKESDASAITLAAA